VGITRAERPIENSSEKEVDHDGMKGELNADIIEWAAKDADMDLLERFIPRETICRFVVTIGILFQSFHHDPVEFIRTTLLSSTLALREALSSRKLVKQKELPCW
jgi:hypothetical protein